jgi:integrase
MPVWEFRPQQFRATVKDPATNRYVSVAKVLGLARSESTWRTARAAERALQQASQTLSEGVHGRTMTVQAWWDVWTDNVLYRRPKPATNINNAERTSRFTARYGALALTEVDRRVVTQWREAGRNEQTIKFLRTMFSDALRAELIDSNPFAALGMARGHGNARREPPSEAMMARILNVAAAVCPPGFAAWLAVASSTGMRPCELDALKWADVDLAGGWFHVRREFCSKSFTFELPKNGEQRIVPMCAAARRALADLPRDSEFVFVNSHGNHWTKPARSYQWDRVRAESGWSESLYLATRHFAGWFMYSKLRLPAEDVAAALGHRDRGDLIRKLYGHFEHESALERVKAAVAASDELAIA